MNDLMHPLGICRRLIAAMARHPDLCVFVGATAIVTAFLVALPRELKENQSSDYVAYYEPVAENLANGRGLMGSDGQPAILTPPLYPLLLSGLFSYCQWSGLSREILLDTFSVFCSGITCLLLFKLTKRVFGIRAGLLSSALCVTYPLFLWLTKQPSSELPFMVFLISSLYFTLVTTGERLRNAAVGHLTSGALIGLAMLVRPIGIGLGILFSVLVIGTCKNFGMRGRVLCAMLLLMGNLAVILPWQVWMWQKTGTHALLSSAGTQSIRDGLTFGVNFKTYRKGINMPIDVYDLMRRYCNRKHEMTSTGAIAGIMWQEFKQTPVSTIKLLLIKACRSWYGTDRQGMERIIRYIQACYVFLLIWALTRMRGLHGTQRRHVIMVISIVAYFWVMTIMVLPIVRYMIPCIIVLFSIVPLILTGRFRNPERTITCAETH